MVSMTSTPLVNLSSLLDDAKCFALVRQHRWPDGVRCQHCGSATVARDGRDDTQPHRQRYRCTACSTRFDDLTGTVLAGHHQPLRVWVLCLYFMGLNLSNRQIARELDLCVSDVQLMTEQLRTGLTPRSRRCSWRVRWRSMRSTSSPGTKASRPLSRKKSRRATAPAEGRARPRHAGEGEAAHPRSASARW